MTLRSTQILLFCIVDMLWELKCELQTTIEESDTVVADSDQPESFRQSYRTDLFPNGCRPLVSGPDAGSNRTQGLVLRDLASLMSKFLFSRLSSWLFHTNQYLCDKTVRNSEMIVGFGHFTTMLLNCTILSATA